MESRNKFNKLKKWIGAFLLIGFFITFLDMVLFPTLLDTSSRETSESADGFTIESYKVVLDVGEDNSIDVQEYITVNFYETGHHGIYRFIPEWLEYTSKDNKTMSRKAKISNLISYYHDYSISTFSGKKQIKMENENITLPTGTYTYGIGYTYDMGADPYNNFDEFIFHAFGDFWGTRINNAMIEINLPKNVDVNNNIHFFADKYRKNDITSYIDYTVSGNTIYAKLSSNYSLTNSLTIDLELPNEYFSNGTNSYGSLSLIFFIICIAFAFISFLLWLKGRKNLNEFPETVEFYPPEQLDASQVGFMYKHDTGRKLSIALIVELACKGFIKIIESEDKTKQTIVKTNYTDVNKAINREIKITKMQDYNHNFIINFSSKHLKNRNLMNDYFKDSNEYIINGNFDDFYKDADYLIKNNYIKIVSDTINNYSSEELENLKQSLVANEFKCKPKMTENEKLIYNQLFKDSDETVLSENHSFYNVFARVSGNLGNEFFYKTTDIKSYERLLLSTCGFAVCSLLWALACFVIKDLNPKLNFMYYLSAIANMAIYVFSVSMRRPSSYCKQIEAKINGFKNHIEFAEKKQIDMLIEENPNYFYDILPYAYVLDVFKKWIEKFENIPVPPNDMGNFNYLDINSLDNLYNSIYYPSSSSSSGCGGGCSSCGGGCSSCGGGGSC